MLFEKRFSWIRGGGPVRSVVSGKIPMNRIFNLGCFLPIREIAGDDLEGMGRGE